MQEPQLLRCRICGDVYFGKHPSHCPYCGAHQKYLIPINAWNDENKGQIISEKDKSNLKVGQGLEFFNTRLYKSAAQSENQEISGYFKYLGRMESEHYGVFCKLLGEEKDPDINIPSGGKGSDLENLELSTEREAIAAKKYNQFANEAENARVKDFFTALVEIETDHLNLDHLEIDKLRKKGKK